MFFRNFASHLGFPTHVPQAAAAARVAGKKDIVEAARLGDISLVADHIAADSSSVHKKDSEYDTATPNLVLNSLLEICLFFVSHFANSIASPSGETPLYWSACRGHLEVCRLLISSKSDVNASDQMYATHTPLTFLK